MEEKSNKPRKINAPNSPDNKADNSLGKKPYYKKRYNPQPRKRKFWNADKIVSLSAMAIALFTLVVLLYQSHILDKQYELTVKQQKASVLPYLFLGPSLQNGKFTITLHNKGLGPAFIKGLYVKEKDSIFVLDNIIDNYYEDYPIKEGDSIKFSYSSIFNGIVLAPGDEMELILATGESSVLKQVSKFYSTNFFGQEKQFFIIEYQSVFEDAWIVESTFQHFTKEEYGEFEFFYDKVE